VRSPSRALPALLLLAAGLASGCALSRHTAEPYRSDPIVAKRVEERAASRCAVEPSPERPFATDACTAWLDGPWRHCCVAHDMAYWCGGSAQARRRADRELRACVAAAVDGWRGAVLGALVYTGVRVGGPPWLPTRGHWGYGRGWPRCYDEPGDLEEGAEEPEEAREAARGVASPTGFEPPRAARKWREALRFLPAWLVARQPSHVHRPTLPLLSATFTSVA